MEKKRDEIVYFKDKLDDVKQGEFENDDDLYNLINDCWSVEEQGYRSSNTEDEDDDEKQQKETCCNNRYSKDEEISRNRMRLIYKGYDNENGVEIAWIEYQVEELTLFEQASLLNTLKLMKDLSHPNFLRHFYVNQKRNWYIIVISELGWALKHYLK